MVDGQMGAGKNRFRVRGKTHVGPALMSCWDNARGVRSLLWISTSEQTWGCLSGLNGRVGHPDHTQNISEDPIAADALRAKVSALDTITALNASLRDSEARARAVLQHVADGIVIADDQGLIELLNRSARTLGAGDDPRRSRCAPASASARGGLSRGLRVAREARP